MPPKKKSRLSSRGPSTPSTENLPPTPLPASQQDYALKPTNSKDLLADPWTDEQETALLKSLMKWKPIGMHKHFRMIAITDYLRSSGYIPRNEEHMRPPGIWEKLRTLYNLPILDAREDTFVTDIAEDRKPATSLYCPFSLPEEDYGDMMFERRLASNGSESAPSEEGEEDDNNIIEQVTSSPPPGVSRKPNRNGRTSRGTRVSRGSKAASLDEDETMQDAGDEDDEADDGTEAEEDEVEEEASTSKGKKRGIKAGRGRGSTRRGGRRR